VAPSQIQIDGNCTIRNFPASNPLSTNFSFLTQPGQNPERWLVIFDNVVHVGQMSCNAVHGHVLWFTNTSTSGIHPSCQNLLIPVEKINKQNPAGQTTATIGVPFTYRLVIPVLFDPATGSVINFAGSVNTLHGITITDDLNATGADLSYVSHTAYWLTDGTPIPHSFSNVGGLLTFDNFPIVPAGDQFVIEITVVLNDSPVNVSGTQFINTAKWDFGRLIDGVFYEPLPGEWGVTPPLTIAAPSLVLTKSGPATMNLGPWGTFVIDVQNTGLSDAWNATIRDLLPDTAAGGMCDLAPEILSARVFLADGVTPAPGQGPLSAGLDYALSYSAAPSCRLDITLLSAAATIGPNERLIITYRTRLDANSQHGVALTNIAGAVQWFNGDSSNPGRVGYTRPLTDGTVSIADHEDPHTVLVALTGHFFEKTVQNLTSGANPATTAAPGDRLRYTLRVRTTDQALVGARIVDDLDALNATAAFAPGTLALVTYPSTADISGTSSTGGTKGTGIIDIRNVNVTVNSEAVIQFDITLASSISNGTIVTNQSTTFRADGTVFALSDDPNVNGTADPDVAGDEDPTRVTISSAPVFRVQKISTDVTGDPAILLAGETLRYTITVKNIGNGNAVNVTLRDVVPANTTYVANSTTLNGTAVPDSAGLSPLVNGMLIHSPADTTPGSMPADPSSDPANVATITFDVVVNANVANGTVISNQGFVTAAGSGIVDHPSDDPDTPIADDPTRDIVGLGYFFEKTVANLTSGINPATTAVPGNTLRYTLRFRTTNQALNDFRIFDDLGALNGGPVFAPGTLALVTYPAGADISNTSSTGGTNGTGVVDIRNLNLPANGEAVIQFDVTLASTLANGTVITNQSTLLVNGTLFASSDDPNVNGPASSEVAGDEDPTRVTIQSSPAFQVQKRSADLTGDPNILLAGETLRYTITVKNIGNGHAVNVMLRDLTPVNTTYVASSTTLNGVPVADSGGLSPLVNGMLIHSPADTTPGSMPADPSNNPANVATITFDVVVDASVVDGTVIANQGLVSASGSGIVDVPSDDPDTPIANDPTRDIVGSLPLLFAEKRTELLVDLGSPGMVDPGDVLRYTITVQNSATIPATGAVLRDGVPANTTYVANSTLLNGLPVGQPDGGLSPLASGINISSPGAGAGTIAPGAAAVLQFDLTVNAGTPAGTVISNQAVVESAEVPDLLTDGDGNPATGPEPTVVVVGGNQQLSITKQVVVVGGGAAVPGAQLEYVVRVVNIAAVPATNVVITDDLNGSQPGQLAYVNGSATMNGSTAGVTVAGSTITASYATAVGALDPGAVVVLRFRATLAPSLVDGAVVTNTAVVTWNQPAQTASASVSVVVGGVPGVAAMNGSAWHDANFDNARDSSERALVGWTVELFRDGQLVHSGLTDGTGAYRIVGVEPNDVSGSVYELQFRAPGAGANTAMLGLANSAFTNGPQRITDIVVRSLANLTGLDLPIRPNGVVYNSMARTPIAGATLTLVNAASGSPLPAGCFDDAAQQGQITLAEGYYKFDVNFSNPSCPSGANYYIGVTAPGPSYVAGYSQIIPPTSSVSTAAFSVPTCPASPADAIPGTGLYCEVQTSEFAPPVPVPPRSAGTVHHVHMRLDGSQMPGTSQIFNNHIPLDPQLAGAIAISKTTPLLNVVRGQQVPYLITVNNVAGLLLTDVTIVDRVPAGFIYVPGSALIDGVPTEPSIAGLELSWSGLVFAGTQTRTVRLLLTVGAGVTEGEYVNRAQVVNGTTGSPMSGEATATVRIVPDPTFDCTDVIGKVFRDANRNGVQDDGEDGLPGVRLVTARGLAATTDRYGRYHITCAITPHESRGSNFVLKLDERTLPSGFRMSTDQTQVKLATRGKALQMNFGASIHRVIGIDLSDAAFEPGTTDLRGQWRPRVDVLLGELRKAPAVLRLSYVADTEDAALVERRVEAIKRQLTEGWDPAISGYVLTIEPEIFWRRGAPPKQPNVRVPGNR
jgi:uncharacterized repeat protein (TIGR01451 family)